MKKNIKIMKKMLCLLAALFISVSTLFAVPEGTYSDEKGNRKVIVMWSGEIYCLDQNGNVKTTWKVVKEDPDGRFQIKLVVNGQPYGEGNYNNAWWREDGQIYLNLANQPRTLTRE